MAGNPVAAEALYEAEAKLRRVEQELAEVLEVLRGAAPKNGAGAPLAPQSHNLPSCEAANRFLLEAGRGG
jgi:hypothetical protein